MRTPSVLPGFGLSLGLTLTYLTLIVLLPLSALFFKALDQSWSSFWAAAFNSRVLSAYRLSFGGALCAALVNAFLGTLIAWVLVRYRFPGQKIVNALVDLPFALPTAVAGLALTALYVPNGWIGQFFAFFNIDIAFTPLGVGIAMVFVGLPFVVRTIEPVLEDVSSDVEEVARTLGANRLQVFCMVILPTILPALLTGTAMAFARAVGEYGSIIFIAGNRIGYTEIAPLLITFKIEQHDAAGAAAIAVVMLSASFLILLLINLLQKWRRIRFSS